MSEVMIAYWSGTGNTEEMANEIAAGVEENGKKAKLMEISSVTKEEIEQASVFALGCPAMGAEVLEEGEVEPFVSSIESIVSGKKIGLFGSYGWGDGQWMRDWEERMRAAGAEIVGGEGVIALEAPDDDAKEQCRMLGKQLAQ